MIYSCSKRTKSSGFAKNIREHPQNPVDLNIRHEQMLETMRFWTQSHLRANQPVNPALFTAALAREEAIKMVKHPRMMD
jgi:hypothetical protein